MLCGRQIVVGVLQTTLGCRLGHFWTRRQERDETKIGEQRKKKRYDGDLEILDVGTSGTHGTLRGLHSQNRSLLFQARKVYAASSNVNKRAASIASFVVSVKLETGGAAAASGKTCT